MKYTSTLLKGFTILEILVALAIVTVLVSASLMSLSGSKTKQDLLTTGNGLVDTLRRAQSRATAQKKWLGLCFKQDGSGHQFARIYNPELSTNNYPSNDDCDSSEMTILTFQFKPGVELCQNCDSNIALNKSIFFRKDGRTTVRNGTPTGFEICLIGVNLQAGNRAREVEITSMGLVKLNNMNDAAGYLNNVTANTGNCQ